MSGFEFNGYLARISDIKSYFDENMKLLKDENLTVCLAANPIYTKIRDDNPTRYINSSVKTACWLMAASSRENRRKLRAVSRRPMQEKAQSQKLCPDAGYRCGSRLRCKEVCSSRTRTSTSPQAKPRPAPMPSRYSSLRTTAYNSS